MTVDELKRRIEQDEAKHKAEHQPGNILISSEHGPTGFPHLRLIVSVLEEQQRQIDELRSRLDDGLRIRA